MKHKPVLGEIGATPLSPVIFSARNNCRGMTSSSPFLEIFLINLKQDKNLGRAWPVWREWHLWLEDMRRMEKGNVESDTDFNHPSLAAYQLPQHATSWQASLTSTVRRAMPPSIYSSTLLSWTYQLARRTGQ